MRWHFRLISPGFQPGPLIASIEAALPAPAGGPAQVRPLLTGRALKRLTACSDAWFKLGLPTGVPSGGGSTLPGNDEVGNECFFFPTLEGACQLLRATLMAQNRQYMDGTTIELTEKLERLLREAA